MSTAKHLHYSSHLPVLLRVMALTEGDVLELGTGVFSTPVLHWLCFSASRRLVSYDSDPKWYATASQYATDWHTVTRVSQWEAIHIERPWDVVLVDHVALRRKEEIRRLASWARYIVVHDTCGRDEQHYHYREVFPLFQYQWQYTLVRPRTTVLSNFVDVAAVLPW